MHDQRSTVNSSDAPNSPSSNSEQGAIEIPSSTFGELLSKFRSLDQDSQAKLQQMREAMNSRRKNASREVAALVASMVPYGDNASQLRFTYGLETIVEEHRKKIEDVERRLEDERLHRRAREEELETLRATVTAIETENAQLKCRLAKRDSYGPIYTTPVVATIEAMKRDRLVMDTQIMKIVERARALEREKEEWLVEKEQLEKHLKELVGRCERMAEKLGAKEILRLKVAHADETVADYKIRLMEIEEERKALCEENESLRQELVRLMSNFAIYSALKEDVRCTHCEESMMQFEDLLALFYRRERDLLMRLASPAHSLGVRERIHDEHRGLQQGSTTVASSSDKNAMCDQSVQHQSSFAWQKPANDQVSGLNERVSMLEAENEELKAGRRSSESIVERLKLDLVGARDLSADLNNQLLDFARPSSIIESESPLSQTASSPCVREYGRSPTESDIHSGFTPLTPRRSRRRRSSSSGIYGFLARATGHTPDRDSATKKIHELQRIAQELTMHVEEKEETIFHLRRLLSEHKDFLVSETSPTSAMPPSECSDTI